MLSPELLSQSDFAPPDVEAAIFRGMAGEVWIDQAQERLTRLDAHLISNVDFGWGIIGKLDKGGTIQIEQADIGGHDWEVTSLKLNMQGQSLDGQISQLSDHRASQPFLPGPGRRGLPEGDSASGKVRSVQRALTHGGRCLAKLRRRGAPPSMGENAPEMEQAGGHGTVAKRPQLTCAAKPQDVAMVHFGSEFPKSTLRGITGARSFTSQ